MDQEVSVSLSGHPYQVTIDTRGHRWLGDEPEDVGGGDTGPQPGELLLSSLGACTAITLKMYANRKKWPVEHIAVELRYNSAAKPNPLTTVIDMEIHFSGTLSEEQHARLLQIAHSCPVHKVLSNPIVINTKAV
ncbi:OsmC family protein [Chitinophaga polysaccharea]|uniref:OsmC family protein n=1 Tax=Chitinophaga TaxID=79328 RepID=UPI0014551621|nr:MULTISPECIES: OsmC family protein [Chitinophaga]NLR57954.1 OsmC family protein [Chitinophaga polysaccharea]NLU93547.1 OsmC family protein [Chitinophaga sp. Ak27]